MTAWTHVRAIAHVELRRKWRATRENAGQLIAIAFVALFFVPFSLGGIVGAYVFGAAIASGTLETPLEWGTIVFGYAWIVVVAFGGYRAYATALRPDRLDGLLTTISHRELLGGITLSEVLLWGVPATTYAAAASLAFAAGARSPIAAPLSFLAVCLSLSTALSVGFLIALAIRNAGIRSQLLTRLRTLFFVGLAIAYLGLIYTQNFAAVLEPVFWLLEPTPVGWYGDLALLGTAPQASIGRGVGAVVASAAILLASMPVLARLAAWLWYADGVHVESETNATTDAGSTAESRLDRYVSRPIAGVVQTDWTRARRSPITLSFVLYPLIVLINPVITVIQTGTIGRSFPLWIVLCGVWIAGALFTLNVVGNEGAVLPATLLGVDPGRTLVGGHVLAGALLAGPVVVVTTAALAILSPHPIETAGTLTASAAVLVACAGPIASGIGTVFPRFDAVSVSRSTKAIVPSTIAFGVYSVVVLLVAAPTLAAHSALVGGAIASAFDTSRVLVAVLGTAGTGFLAATVGLLSARHAIRSIERFHFD
ncbi:hypothetical protein [Natrarchaeobius oligotrophus]|uniref:Uncharacterized protein n=1 Tax=Natrarchaeobius chitinivorans TaxID=1679083 RepID=A0A3N6MYV4_NATCH|nr:hypothetical protein [Natrarchaeobius chitinivorans]RQH00267.1 hypothetical protein EA472_10385 [Natrarchaeobius chitinivorans]